MNGASVKARWLPAPARRALIVLCLAGLGLSAGLTSPTEAAKQRCNDLRGNPVLTTKSVRVVRRHFSRIYKKDNSQDIGHELFACARPRGRIHDIASDDATYLYPGTTRTSPIESTRAFLHQTAGTFLILVTESGNLTGDYVEKTDEVVDGATGKRYRFFHELMSPGGTSRPETSSSF